MRSVLLCCALAALLAAFPSAHARAASEKLPSSPPVLELPTDAVADTVGLTLDGRHWAYAVRTADGKQRLIVDGKPSAETYDKVGRIFLWPDGSGYEVSVVDGGRTYEVHDGRRLGPFDDAPYWPVLGKNGFLAFVARKDGACRWVMGETTLPYDVDCRRGSYTLSPDGTRLAFGAQAGPRAFIVLDGRPLQEWDEVRAPQFSSDSKTFTYLAREGRAWHVVVDGKAGPPMDLPALPSVSARGRVAYIERRAGRDSLVVDGKLVGSFDRITAGPIWSGRRLAFAVSNRSAHRVSINGRWSDVRGGSVTDLALDARGRLRCYAVSDGRTSRVVFNGAAGPRFDAAWDTRLSPDGRHCGYAAKRGGRTYAVIDGKEGPPTEAFGAPDFSKDSAHYAYAGGPERLRFVVWDGRMLGPFDEASVLAPGPDVADLSYVASKDGKWWIEPRPRTSGR